MTEARNAAAEERLEQEAAAEGGEAANADNERDRPAAEAPADTLNAEANAAESREGEADASAAGEETAEQEAEAAPEADPRDARIAELESQIEEYRQRLLRAQADFDNFRRRTQREKEELAKYASMELISRLLPVLDNFERAIGASKDSGDFEALAKGVDMIHRQLLQLLEQEGLKPMETVGQPFNPEFHEAVMRVESDEHEEGTVVEELQRGYILKDRVIRPAMVKVSG
ncbi:Protein grpE [Thermobacillus xylanilyticus]|jgi:molecular chaperone GrpE|uniref:Protein GrpE n=1 Tax=Thermobacillus xylanilyticus TaxID=76633 RepID=A0ABM8V9C2_THEXY|nr:nucleotide exchange factor GrpE [Thermobacillus xylanilyticus]CAG5093338.1 Protein grpE [Thermobacillus xylanilyticus]